MFVQVPLAHRRILRGEFFSWLAGDVLLPTAFCAALFLCAWWLGAGAWPRWLGAIGAAGAAALSAALLGLILPHPRQDAMRVAQRLSERLLRRG
jgi:hypothetical protein